MLFGKFPRVEAAVNVQPASRSIGTFHWPQRRTAYAVVGDGVLDQVADWMDVQLVHCDSLLLTATKN
jgi:hypothetical protein